MKVFYHGVDNDGKCSGFWVRKLAKHYDNYETKFVGINYGDNFPMDTIQKDEQVFIVDYSIFPEEMKKLLEITRDVTYIDHHASAIQRYENFPYDIPGIRYDGIAGCELTYCYLTCVNDGKEPTVDDVLSYRNSQPLFSKYIGDFDVWKFEYGEDIVKAFERGLALENTHPHSLLWDVLCFEDETKFGTKMADITMLGKQLIHYDDVKNASACEHKGFECEFEGHKCFAINQSGGTDTFKSLDQDKYEMYICFTFDGSQWTYSLRSGFGKASKDVNVSELAMKYGGGGHVHAAGFNSKELLVHASILEK